MEHTSCQISLWLPCDSLMWREDTITRGRSGCMAGQAGHTWWDQPSWAVPGLCLCLCICPGAAWLWISLLRCSPELLRNHYYTLWKNLPVLLSPHPEVFLACQYSDKKYLQLSVLLSSIYSGGVKACVQPKWRGCLCSGCSAVTAGCRGKTHETSSLFFSLLEDTVAFGNPCRQDAGRAVVTADVCSSCSGFTVHRSLFSPSVWGEQCKLLHDRVSITDSSSVHG